jgi:capsular exopolysaccharide synthesis family protein
MLNNQATDLAISASVPLPANNSQYYAQDEEKDLHLLEHWHILVKRKWWFLSVLSGFIAAALLTIFFMTPVYMGKITLQIVQDNPSALIGGATNDPRGALTGTTQIDRFYETQYKILQSPTLAYGLIDTLKLNEHPSYKKLEEASKGLPPEVIRQNYAESLMKNIKVEPGKKSFLVDISFTSPDKELARKLPEAFQGEYLKLCMNMRQQSYKMIREWLDSELTRLGKKLEVSEENLYAQGQNKDSLSLEEPQFNVIIQKYVELGRVLTAAQADRVSKEAQCKQVVEQGPDAPLITNNSLIVQLRQNLIDLESQSSGSSKIFGANYPEQQAQTAKLKELRDRLGREVKRVEAGLKAELDAATRAEKLLQKEFNAQKAKVIDMENGLVEHHILKRDLQTNQTLYEALLARMKEASIATTMVASNVSVITPAAIPYAPSRPKPSLYILIALVIGTIAGIGAAFTVEYCDSSIKNVEDLEKFCRIPSLGMIPLADSEELAKSSNTPELAAYSTPMSLIGESIFHIRTAIMRSASEAPPQVITITSASPEEGKTTSSSNIACGLAGADRKCLIMDCDLRKPRLHKVYNVSNERGLTDYLAGGATLQEIIRPTPVPNLYFIPAGPATSPNPNDLFASKGFRKLVNLLRHEFSHIILDSPPIIGFADAQSLALHADGTVLVIKHHSTSREAGRLAVKLLSQNGFQILGGILAMVRKELIGYGCYYAYYGGGQKSFHRMKCGLGRVAGALQHRLSEFRWVKRM